MSIQSYTPYVYSSDFISGEYHHVTLSISGTIHTLYLDGSAVAINTNAGNVFSTYSTIMNPVIGAQTLTLIQAFQGIIGDVRIYNYPISSDTISSLYLNRNLVVHYTFDSSVNFMLPNYGTMMYDASFVGGANTITPGYIGENALTVTNTEGAAATQYVYSKPGIPDQVDWNFNATNGLTVSFWVNTSGATSGNIMRIFDIPTTSGIQGLAVDISGNNMIYSGYSGFYMSGSNFTTSLNGYTYHVFTNSGTLTVQESGNVEYLIIGGGGVGGSSHGGGGGSGRVVSNYTGTLLNVSTGSFPVIVGSGGVLASSIQNVSQQYGGNSSCFNIVALGGGYGGSASFGSTNTYSNDQSYTNPKIGGSGGGGGGYEYPQVLDPYRTTGASNNSDSSATTCKYNLGNSGGDGNQSYDIPIAGSGGGGGGAGGVGVSAIPPTGSFSSSLEYSSKVSGNGGPGTNIFSTWLNAIQNGMSNITGWQTATSDGYIAAGGGGGGYTDSSGGIGGGGSGSNIIAASPGIANTGSGGGGGMGGSTNTSWGGVGGSGLVVIRYTSSST